MDYQEPVCEIKVPSSHSATPNDEYYIFIFTRNSNGEKKVLLRTQNWKSHEGAVDSRDGRYITIDNGYLMADMLRINSSEFQFNTFEEKEILGRPAYTLRILELDEDGIIARVYSLIKTYLGAEQTRMWFG